MRHLMRYPCFCSTHLNLNRTAVIAVPRSFDIELNEIREIFEEKYDMEIIPPYTPIHTENRVFGGNF